MYGLSVSRYFENKWRTCISSLLFPVVVLSPSAEEKEDKIWEVLCGKEHRRKTLSSKKLPEPSGLPSALLRNSKWSFQLENLEVSLYHDDSGV